MTCAVLVPQGKIALGKLAQALVHGAQILQVDGNFDDCLELARKTRRRTTRSPRWSTRSTRTGSQGQKTAAFEIVDALGDAPDIHCLPVGNAGNITAYWMGYTRVPRATASTTRLPRMLGFQAAGAAPLVHGAAGARTRRPSPPRSGSATPRRGRRRSTARDESAAGSPR